MEMQVLEIRSREAIDLFVEEKVRAVRDGEINPLELRNQLTLINKSIDKINEETKSEQLKEAQKYGAKSFEAYGSRIEITELGVKYDYGACKDKVWNELNKKLEDIKKDIKERESFLKTIKTKLTTVDEDTGETSEIYPVIKTSTTGIKVTPK